MKASEMKLIRKQMEKENRKRPPVLTPVERDKWPEHGDDKIIEVWISNRYLAQVFLEQVFDDKPGVLRVSVCRTSIDYQGMWEANLSWDELMEVKRQIGRDSAYAVEVLPPDEDIVNVANMRHFWILPVAVVGWKNDKGLERGVEWVK